MKSIPVRVEGPALTSGQSPTYYEYNNGLTGIIEHLRSSRSIALLYPLCWFMTPCDGEEDSSGTRVPSMREKIGIVAFLFLSSLRGAFSHEPSSSYRESRYRFRISERRCKARGIHVFLNERNVDANGRSRISITSA